MFTLVVDTCPQQLSKHGNGSFSSSGSSRIYSFDVLRSDPSSSSLQHIASSATLPNRASVSQVPSSNGSAPVFSVHSGSLPRPSSGASSTRLHHHNSTRPHYPPRSPPMPSNSEHATYSSEELSDDGDDKKHVCTTCHKKFNRPSSLRIHMNTHTGATRKS